MAFLCISIDNSSVNNIHLMDGELIDIDKYTCKYDKAKDILKEYPEKVEEFKSIYRVDNSNDIKLRIFLPDDKERFVMYRKHLIAFKFLIKDREFLKYAITYEDNLFDKKYCDSINNEEVDDVEALSMLKEYIDSLDEDDYYDIVRRICFQYGNYTYDNEEENHPSIDVLFKNYLAKLKKTKVNKPKIKGNIKKVEEKEEPTPFAVFKHPKFADTYGKAIDKTKNIFILGGLMTESTKPEYVEIYENTVNCFNNKIYYPMNANVNLPLTKEFKKLYDNSILVIVDGNGLNDALDEKIIYATQKGITVLIVIEEQKNYDLFAAKYEDNDMIVLLKYHFGDFGSKKAFADICLGLYINEKNEDYCCTWRSSDCSSYSGNSSCKLSVRHGKSFTES